MDGLIATVELVPVECPACGMTFAVPRLYFDERVATQQFFWCPEAHNLQLGVPGPLEILERQRVQLADEVTALTGQVSVLRQEIIEHTLRGGQAA